MSNLRRIANTATRRINPNITASWRRANGGYTIEDDGTQVPSYESFSIRVQAQPVAAKFLHLENMNVEGVKKSLYCYPNNIMGPVRPDVRGGDLIDFPQTPGREAQTWKVLDVIETWPDWSHVIAVLQ